MKMKKLAAALLAMIMAVSMTACGEKENDERDNDRDNETSEVRDDHDDEDDEDADENDDSAQTVEASAPASTSEAEAENTTTATTAPAEPEVPVELPVLNVEPALIMNGCMAFKCDGKNYVYNITDNELYETEYDVNNITTLNGCIAIIGHLSYDQFNNYYDNIDRAPYVVNLKTGETYSDVIPISCDNNYISVGKLEEGFSESTFSMGVLDNKGEWTLPLSDKHAVCKINDIEKISWTSQNDDTMILYADGSFRLYDIKTGELTTPDVAPSIFLDMTNKNIVLDEPTRTDRNTVVHTLYNYNTNLSEKTLIIENLPEKLFEYKYNLSNGNFLYYTDGYNFRLYDAYHNHLTDYNLEDYNLANDGVNSYKNIKSATEVGIVFTAKNASNDLYTIVLNKNGNNICDPIKGDIGASYFSENKIMFVSDDTDRIIDINTGEITEYDSTFDIINYDDTNDLMLVNTNGSYYLVDPEAPETLINPFERVYN